MYCRECGSVVNDKAEICVKCGCRPNIGHSYCQECGSPTKEKQEVCIKCGCRLTNGYNSSSILNNLGIGSTDSTNYNYDFSDLPSYYQKEFNKIASSNEAYKGKFNGWAFLFGAVWALTKGCWLSAIIAFIVSVATAGVGGIIYWFIYGFRGTYIYYNAHVKNKQKIV